MDILNTSNLCNDNKSITYSNNSNLKNIKYDIVKSKNVLNYMYLNINSIKNKIDDLTILLDQLNNSIDIIFITEIRISDVDKRSINIPGYKIEWSCRKSNIKKSGGGVAIAIRNNIKYSVVKEIKNEYDNILLINIPEYQTNFGVMYHPPDSKNSDEFFNNLNLIMLKVH
jgi:exonuclease III